MAGMRPFINTNGPGLQLRPISIIIGQAQGSFLPLPATRWREKQWRQSGDIQKTLPPSLVTGTTVHMVGAGQGEPCACVREEYVHGLGVWLLPAWSVEGKLQAMSKGGRGMVVRRPSRNYLEKPHSMSDEWAANWWDKLGTHDLIIKHPIQPKKIQLFIEESLEY